MADGRSNSSEGWKTTKATMENEKKTSLFMYLMLYLYVPVVPYVMYLYVPYVPYVVCRLSTIEYSVTLILLMAALDHQSIEKSRSPPPLLNEILGINLERNHNNNLIYCYMNNVEFGTIYHIFLTANCG